MSETSDKAKNNFLSGISCSQSVFGAFAEEYGIDPELAYRIASSFGGGIAHTGGLCGAVTGSLMSLGLKYGKPRAMTPEEKGKLDAKAQEFMRRFQEENKSMKCRELLGYNVGIPEEKAECMAKGVTRKRCPNFIEKATKILEELIMEEKENKESDSNHD